jgi:hypothetical protein
VAYLGSVYVEMLNKIMKIAKSGSLSMNQDAMSDYTHRKQCANLSTAILSPMWTYVRL